MRRTAAALVLAVLPLAACGGDDGEEAAPTTTEVVTTTAAGEAAEATTTTTAPAAEDPLGGFVPAPLQWERCGSRLQCATLAVPLDWSDPTGTTIDLAVTRIPAGGEPLGAIATNPGGPGASGNEMIAAGSPFDRQLTDAFDTLSWDPRGVGDSAGLVCDEEVVDDFVNLDTDPDTPEEAAALDAGAEAVGAGCEAGSGALLPHVGTGSVARDLEAIHRAYGGPMGYVGFSYGTSIGLEYLELFGGAMEHGVVLDGVVDPTHTQTDLLRGQAIAFEAILDGVLEDAGVAAEYDELAARIETEPVDAGGDVLEPGDLATGAIYALYAPQLHAALVDGIRDALGGDGSTIVDLAEAYRSVGGFGIYQAVSCTDSANPRGGEAWTAFAEELEAIAPRTGPAVANEMRPCAFWPVPPTPITGPVVAEGSGPVLVIGTTGDPATPVEQAEEVAATLADGHLLVFEGEGHTAYFSSGCVQDAVAAYLLDGTVPEDGARC